MCVPPFLPAVFDDELAHDRHGPWFDEMNLKLDRFRLRNNEVLSPHKKGTRVADKPGRRGAVAENRLSPTAHDGIRCMLEAGREHIGAYRGRRLVALRCFGCRSRSRRFFVVQPPRVPRGYLLARIALSKAAWRSHQS